jgi:RNA polymerase sigma factor (sigma-70 family)
MTAAPLDTVLRHIRKLTAAADEPTDGQCLRRFTARRDESAFTELVRRHGPLVLGVCRRLLPDPCDAEDAFQATFLVLVRRAATLDARRPLGPWLYGVARRTALKARAAALRRLASQTEVFDMAAPETVPFEDRERYQLLEEELDRLPGKYRDPLVLCYLQGRTHEQAARALGRPSGSMSRHVGRALNLLRGRLGRRGVVLSAAAVAGALTNDLACGAVPPAMTAGTVRVALLVAAGGMAAPAVADLAGAVACDLTPARVKAATILLLGVAVLGGAGLAALGTRATPAEPPAPATARPEAEAAERADGDDDPLPAGALIRLGSPRLRHGQAVSGLAFSKDGKTLASGSWDRTLRLWELPSGKELRRFEGHTGFVRCVALSPDGTVLASGGVEEFCLWDAATGRRLFRSSVVNGDVWGVAFSPDGKTVAHTMQGPVTAGGSTGALIVDAATGKDVVSLVGHTNIVRAVAFSPDGKTVATASHDQTVRLWDPATGKETAQLAGHSGGVLCVAFSADGKTLASGGSDGTVRLWDIATRTETKSLEADAANRGGVAGVSFSPDGKLVAAGAAGARVVRVFELASGKEVHTFPAGLLRCVAFSPDGNMLAAGDGNDAIRMWDMPGGKALSPVGPHEAGVHCIALAPDGRSLAAGTYLNTVHLWDVTTGRPLRRLEGHEHGVYPVAYAPDGKRVASGSRDGTARVWDAATGKELRRFLAYDGEKAGDVWVYGLSFAPDGKRLAGACRDRIVRVWDIDAGNEVARCEGHAGLVSGVAFGRDGKTLFSCGADGAVRVWDATTGRQLRSMGEATWNGESIAVSPNGRVLAVGCRDGKVRLFNAGAGVLLHEMTEHADYDFRNRLFHDGRTLAFSPDGRMVASGSWRVVQVWDVATGQERLAFPAHQSVVMSVAFLPDGRRLATAGPDTIVLLWDLPACALGGPPAKVTAADMETLWTDLLSDDGHKSYRAMWTLAAASKDVLTLLRSRLKPAAVTEHNRLERLIKDLDADDFETREKATAELEQIGAAAEAPLRKALEQHPSAELKQRAESLLAKQRAASASPEQVREARALELLEHLGTPEATALLKELAKGADGAWLTEEAKAALKRTGH